MQFREFCFSQNPDCDLCAQYRMIEPSKNLHEGLKGKTKMNEYIITPGELQKSLQNNDDLQLIDVRTSEKHQAYNIGGKLIPLDELPHRLNELDPNKLVVTYCTSGGRSMVALKLLVSAGFTAVKSLDGGVTAWQEQNKII